LRIPLRDVWRWGGVDSVWEQKKLKATLREMLAVGAARRPYGRQSPASCRDAVLGA